MSKVEIFAKNMELNDRITEYVNKKVTRLDKFLTGIDEIRIDMNYIKSARNSSDRQVAQITLRGKGFILRTEERADDLFAAFDTALDKIQRQIERYKGKKNRGRGNGKSAAEVLPEAMVEEAAEILTEPVIARRKAFKLTPMDEVDALEQMSLLGHENFFVFFNIKTQAVNVIYRRRNGTFGLIETQME